MKIIIEANSIHELTTLFSELVEKNSGDTEKYSQIEIEDLNWPIRIINSLVGAEITKLEQLLNLRDGKQIRVSSGWGDSKHSFYINDLDGLGKIRNIGVAVTQFIKNEVEDNYR